MTPDLVLCAMDDAMPGLGTGVGGVPR